MNHRFGAACIGLLAALPAAAQSGNSLTAQEQAAGWRLLFDGRTLDGWTTPGDPGAWGVENGELSIVKPGGGWWLRTTKMYRDFELKIDFNLAPGANSGLGLRGSSVGDPAFTGMEVQIFDSPGAEPTINNCGAVYNAIVPTAQAVKPAGEWNTFHVRLVGDTLDVWLNGEQIHKDQKLDERGYFRAPEQTLPLRDRLPTGYISMQDHGDKARFRNIKILDRSSDPDPGTFEPVFNGRDLTGWSARGTARWTVEDGTLIGRDGPGHLFSDASFTNLEMRAFVRVNTKGNSGFYFRTVPNAQNPDTWPTGYEAQVDQHDPKNFTGCIYGKAWPTTATGPITRDHAWLDYRVRAEGNVIRTWVNGVQMVEATLDEFSRGHIALQSHHPGNEVRWRDIQARTLDASGADGAVQKARD